MTTLTEELEAIRCHHDKSRGMLISNPPQYLCEYCGNTWIYGTQTPVCPVLKNAVATTLRGLQMPEKWMIDGFQHTETAIVGIHNKAIQDCQAAIDALIADLEAV